MKLSRVLAPIVAATFILTGCGGQSESDCTKVLNKYLQKQEVSIPIPGEVDSSATKIIGYLSFLYHQMIL